MHILLAMRLWIGRRGFFFLGTLGSIVVRISRQRVIKGQCDPIELEALEYIVEHTAIPIPKDFRTCHDHGQLYIEMEYIPGVNLQAAWLGGVLSQEQKKDIVKILASYVEQLRSFHHKRR